MRHTHSVNLVVNQSQKIVCERKTLNDGQINERRGKIQGVHIGKHLYSSLINSFHQLDAVESESSTNFSLHTCVHLCSCVIVSNKRTRFLIVCLVLIVEVSKTSIFEFGVVF